MKISQISAYGANNQIFMGKQKGNQALSTLKVSMGAGATIGAISLGVIAVKKGKAQELFSKIKDAAKNLVEFAKAKYNKPFDEIRELIKRNDNSDVLKKNENKLTELDKKVDELIVENAELKAKFSEKIKSAQIQPQITKQIQPKETEQIQPQITKQIQPKETEQIQNPMPQPTEQPKLKATSEQQQIVPQPIRKPQIASEPPKIISKDLKNLTFGDLKYHSDGLHKDMLAAANIEIKLSDLEALSANKLYTFGDVEKTMYFPQIARELLKNDEELFLKVVSETGVSSYYKNSLPSFDSTRKVSDLFLPQNADALKSFLDKFIYSEETLSQLRHNDAFVSRIMQYVIARNDNVLAQLDGVKDAYPEATFKIMSVGKQLVAECKLFKNENVSKQMTFNFDQSGKAQEVKDYFVIQDAFKSNKSVFLNTSAHPDGTVKARTITFGDYENYISGGNDTIAKTTKMFDKTVLREYLVNDKHKCALRFLPNNTGGLVRPNSNAVLEYTNLETGVSHILPIQKSYVDIYPFINDKGALVNALDNSPVKIWDSATNADIEKALGMKFKNEIDDFAPIQKIFNEIMDIYRVN